MVKFDFTKRDIAMMAAFLALMMVAEAIWILGSVFAPFGIGIYYGAVLIIAAIVIGKRYTILTLGIAKTIIMLLIPDTYGGSLAAICYLIGAIVLESALYLSEPYAENLKTDLLGILGYGIIYWGVYAAILTMVYGMALPQWAIIIGFVVYPGSFLLGGFLGYKLGNKVKNVIESV
ncbi:MAG: hypothetical protein A4E27_01452 [Methanobacterium sp. PtaU1.Bin242]|nr:MAG: hypothetical protein A4E27_01452 [Methanobacterium sp. PtaU1.Bin242]